MFDPFSYDGPKSRQRSEDERYIRALQMRDEDGTDLKVIAEALGFKYDTLRYRLWIIDKDSAKMETA